MLYKHDRFTEELLNNEQCQSTNHDSDLPVAVMTESSLEFDLKTQESLSVETKKLAMIWFVLVGKLS